MSRFSLKVPQGQDWDAIARLVSSSIPNYVVSQLGPCFGALYYRRVATHPGAFGLAAYDETDNLVGFILGSLNAKAARRLTLPGGARLLLAANVRLLSPAFLGWLVRGVLSGRPGRSQARKRLPAAELVILVVSPAFRGKGLSALLLEALEEFFRRHHLRAPYLILTEKENLASNRFYEKFGACFIRTYQHHGREINQWQKLMAW